MPDVPSSTTELTAWGALMAVLTSVGIFLWTWLPKWVTAYESLATRLDASQAKQAADFLAALERQEARALSREGALLAELRRQDDLNQTNMATLISATKELADSIQRVKKV